MSEEVGAELRQKIGAQFWPRLVRRVTRKNLAEAAFDPKAPAGSSSRVFVPSDTAGEELAFYRSDPSVTVERLRPPDQFDDDYIYRVSYTPGLLALEYEAGAPVPYVIPGGRFNEFFGWDSYFMALGLIQDGFWAEAATVATQFAYEINHYGRILNANRSYFLGRSQPPFLTDLAWRLQQKFPDKFAGWMHAAIREYQTVWMAAPRYDAETQLSRYTAAGRGIPPEVEPGHFDKVLEPYARKHGVSVSEFSQQYNDGSFSEPALDDFFRHDRAVRESGHDVTSRFFEVCADLVTADLASLLYKYEVDIARAIAEFPAEFPSEKAEEWQHRASTRKRALNTFLWDEEQSRFCDYNVATHAKHAPLVPATILWPLWSGCATPEQAAAIVKTALPHIDLVGGIASTSKLESSQWQWDYPAGWAPHQILAWEGLEKYGFHGLAKRLAKSWLATITKGYELSNGAVFEKYDVTGVDAPQDVRSEYGNQGNNETGFGWTNASFAIAWDRYQKG